MSQLCPAQWANFTAKIETLCGEFLHAIRRDRYSPAEVIQAAWTFIVAAIDETEDKDLAIQPRNGGLRPALSRPRASTRRDISISMTDRSRYVVVFLNSH